MPVTHPLPCSGSTQQDAPLVSDDTYLLVDPMRCKTEAALPDRESMAKRFRWCSPCLLLLSSPPTAARSSLV